MSFPWLSPNQQHQSQWSGFILCTTSFLWRATLPVHWLSSAKTFTRLLQMTFSSVYLFCIDLILISNEQKTTIPHCYLQIAPCCQHQHQQLEAVHPHLMSRHHCQSQPECFDSLSSTRQIHHYSEYTITITNYHTEMINTATQNLYSKIIPHCFMEILCEIKIDKHQHFTGRLTYPFQFPPFFHNLHTRDMKPTHEFINRAFSVNYMCNC